MVQNKIIQDNNFLNSEQKKFINEVILGENFPFFWNENAVDYDSMPFLCHTVVKRKEERLKEEPFFNTLPDFGNMFLSILNSFCEKNKIKYKEIFRIAVNLTINIGMKKSKIHIDHEFEHNQLIVYLDDFKDTPTVILNSQGKKILKKINPKKFNAVYFNNNPHYMFLPKNKRRTVIVYTFI
jgi:hypothetical protein